MRTYELQYREDRITPSEQQTAHFTEWRWARNAAMMYANAALREGRDPFIQVIAYDAPYPAKSIVVFKF
jgi:hypothetical protein